MYLTLYFQFHNDRPSAMIYLLHKKQSKKKRKNKSNDKKQKKQINRKTKIHVYQFLLLSIIRGTHFRRFLVKKMMQHTHIIEMITEN